MSPKSSSRKERRQKLRCEGRCVPLPRCEAERVNLTAVHSRPHFTTHTHHGCTTRTQVHTLVVMRRKKPRGEGYSEKHVYQYGRRKKDGGGIPPTNNGSLQMNRELAGRTTTHRRNRVDALPRWYTDRHGSKVQKTTKKIEQGKEPYVVTTTLE